MVVKITGDPADAAAWEQVRRAQPMPNVSLSSALPVVYAVWAFPSSAFSPGVLPAGVRLFGVLVECIPTGLPPEPYDSPWSGEEIGLALDDWAELTISRAKAELWRLVEELQETGGGVGEQQARLVEAVGHLWEIGIWPRDLMSEGNVVWTTDGRLVIVDLGVSAVPRTRLPGFDEVPLGKILARWGR